MHSRQRRLPLPPTDIVTVVVATAAVFFMLAFGGKALESYRLQRHNAFLRSQIADLEEQREQLQEHLEYVQSPEYVEKVAREQYKWTKPGEKLVVPIFRESPSAPSATGPDQLAAETVTTESASHWSDWLDLLFGPFD